MPDTRNTTGYNWSNYSLTQEDYDRAVQRWQSIDSYTVGTAPLYTTTVTTTTNAPSAPTAGPSFVQWDDIEEELAQPAPYTVQLDPARPRGLNIGRNLNLGISSNVSLFTETVGKTYGKRGFTKDKYETKIALELENETLTEMIHPEPVGWQYHNEGSLRHYGFEYVCNGPYDRETLVDLLDKLLRDLKRAANKHNAQFTSSARTSTHVHFDVTKYEYLDLVNFACLYWILEEFLSHYAGEDRKTNLFCLRLKDSTAMAAYLQQEIGSLRPFSSSLYDDMMRYASVNFAAVRKFGSLEFRMMRGSIYTNEIMTWVDALSAIKSYALKFKTPRDLREFFIKTNAEEIPKIIFGKTLFDTLLKSHPNPDKYPKEIRNGFLAVHTLLSCHKTFDFTEEIEKEKKKIEEQRKREQEEQARFEEEQRRQVEALQEIVTVDQSIIPDGVALVTAPVYDNIIEL